MDEKHGGRFPAGVVRVPPGLDQIDRGFSFIFRTFQLFDLFVQGQSALLELEGLLVGDGQQGVVETACQYGVQKLVFRFFNGFDFQLQMIDLRSVLLSDGTVHGLEDCQFCRNAVVNHVFQILGIDCRCLPGTDFFMGPACTVEVPAGFTIFIGSAFDCRHAAFAFFTADLTGQPAGGIAVAAGYLPVVFHFPLAFQPALGIDKSGMGQGVPASC